jgi:hypothetical protein
MRQVSQVDPWGGCPVCHEEVRQGRLPYHDWRHRLRTWLFLWRRPGPRPKPEKPEKPVTAFAGVRSPLYSLAGMAVAALIRTGRLEKEAAT